eukprot:13835578-Alexandrium_andersonii.AAC.1
MCDHLALSVQGRSLVAPAHHRPLRFGDSQRLLAGLPPGAALSPVLARRAQAESCLDRLRLPAGRAALRGPPGRRA